MTAAIAARARLSSPRYFTKNLSPGLDAVFATCGWKLHDVEIKDASGEVVFAQTGVEAPDFWSVTSVTVVASKYFRGRAGSAEREFSVKQLITRVVTKTVEWTERGGYFEGDDAVLAAFRDELAYALLHQYFAFNSPVWFNLGWNTRRQAASACYISSIEDTMESILDEYKVEGALFKDGSGVGVNLSKLRSSKESLAAGGHSSGPVSFMRGFDASAGSIKSGGSTRRAACMRELNDDHPDIFDFVRSKVVAERAAHALIDSGQFSGEFNLPGNAYEQVGYQNANHSVHASDAFMRAVESGGMHQLRAVTTGAVVEEIHARDLFDEIVDAAHFCGDPGMQFSDTMNRWHTSPSGGRINGTNPCSEFVYIDNSACNLASVNLTKFLDARGSFDVETFSHVVRTAITAMETFVGFASYPTDTIKHNSHDYRPLGIGYTSLGALLMMKALPYDSDAGRAYAAALTSLLSSVAYERSAEIASVVGPFPAYSRHEQDREATRRVMGMHASAAAETCNDVVALALPPDARSIAETAYTAWQNVEHATASGDGVRNGQISVLAPVGTISFLMGSDTTGIEPATLIVAYKKLVGGGTLKLVCAPALEALKRLGYGKDVEDYVLAHGGVAGAPGFRDEDIPVFDTALGPRAIAPMGHVRMMAAVTPFLSGSASKTVNMPESATAEDIAEIYMQAWKLGLKAISIYRDGCKRSQPLSAKKDKAAAIEKAKEKLATHLEERKTGRRRLPNERAAITHKFAVAGHEGYITVGLYEDGTPGEVFVTMSKEGSTISGLMDTVSTLTSLALQYGCPVTKLAEKFAYVSFEPSGFTGNKDIPMAKSVVDYVFRWLDHKFGSAPVSIPKTEVKLAAVAHVSVSESHAPVCSNCGSLTQRAGACHTCPTCGTTSGCS